jgi:hypothetical protein
LQVSTPQTPDTHEAVAFAAMHACPHAPQLVSDVARFTSQPSDACPLQSPNPLSHVRTQLPLWQLAVAFEPAAHTTPHAPQLARLESDASQPFAATPSQSPNPALQLPIPHTPFWHAAVPFAVEQASPHAPQLVTLEARLVSQPFARSPSQLARPLGAGGGEESLSFVEQMTQPGRDMVLLASFQLPWRPQPPPER